MKKTVFSLMVVVALGLAAVAAQAAGVDLHAQLHGLQAFASTPEGAAGLTGLAAIPAMAGMASNYSHSGDVIDYVNTTGGAIAANSVVKMGGTLGVALVDIAAGDTGSVRVRGVFEVPKVAGAVIAQGESLTWDVSAGKFDDNAAVPAAGDVTGAAAFAAESKGNATNTILVCFTGAPGTVTA